MLKSLADRRVVQQLEVLVEIEPDNLVALRLVVQVQRELDSWAVLRLVELVEMEPGSWVVELEPVQRVLIVGIAVEKQQLEERPLEVDCSSRHLEFDLVAQRQTNHRHESKCSHFAFPKHSRWQ